MTLQEQFADFNKVAPIETIEILGHPFAYRFYKKHWS